MKSAFALDKDSYELFEGFEDDEEEGIDNGAEFDWEMGDFDAELTEFEGDEEVRRRTQRGGPRSLVTGGTRRSLVTPRFSRPGRRRRPRRDRRIFPGLALRRRRLTVGFPPEETLQGAEYVRWVQASLNRVLALRLPVNGILGPETRSAVRRFQQSERLPVTGIVGPDTERALIAALARIAPAEPAEPEPSDGELDDLEFTGDAGEWGEEVADFLQEENGARRRARRRTAPVTRPSCRAADVSEVFGVPVNVVRALDRDFEEPVHIPSTRPGALPADGKPVSELAFEMSILTAVRVDDTHTIEVNPAFLAVNALAETDHSNRLRPKLGDMANKLVDFERRLINTLEGASLADRFLVWQRLARPLQWALVRLSFKGDFASAQRILQRSVRDIKRGRNPLCNFPLSPVTIRSAGIRSAVIRAAQALHLANTFAAKLGGSVACPLKCRTSRPPARRRRQDRSPAR